MHAFVCPIYKYRTSKYGFLSPIVAAFVTFFTLAIESTSFGRKSMKYLF